MENYQDALGALILMLGLVAVVFIIARYTYLTKKALIESGLQTKTSPRKNQLVDWGCILGALGVGFVLSTGYTTLNLGEDTTDLLVWGTLLLCGALGLFLAHYLRRKIGDN